MYAASGIASSGSGTIPTLSARVTMFVKAAYTAKVVSRHSATFPRPYRPILSVCPLDDRMTAHHDCWVTICPLADAHMVTHVYGFFFLKSFGRFGGSRLVRGLFLNGPFPHLSVGLVPVTLFSPRPGPCPASPPRACGCLDVPVFLLTVHPVARQGHLQHNRVCRSETKRNYR